MSVNPLSSLSSPSPSSTNVKSTPAPGPSSINKQHRRPGCRPLPIELWVRIMGSISNSNALPHAWLTGRRVSRAVRAATEEAFLHRHLVRPGRAHVTFRGLGSVRDGGGWRHYLNLALEFDRLSEDRTRVVFSNKRALREEEEEEEEEVDGGEAERAERKAAEQVVEDALTARWRAAMKLYQGDGYGARVDLAPYTITLRQIVNDTELPGLEIDYEAREMSFDWRGMLDRLLGEEWHAMKLNARMRNEEREPKALEVQRSIQAGETELLQGISQMMRIMSERERRAYRDARRSRIRRWYAEHEGYELEDDYFEGDFQEKQKLKDLRVARKYGVCDAESEDEEFPDVRREVFDEGMGFSRIDGGDPLDDAFFAGFEPADDDLEDDLDGSNGFEAWLRTALPSNVNLHLPDSLLAAVSDEEGSSYEEYTDAEDDDNLD